jgi:hypothetical protein
MAKMKKKGVAKRFDDLASKNASHPILPRRAWDLAIEYGMPYASFAIRRPIIDWGNLDFRAKVAETSLRLSDQDTDNGLQRAFIEAQLDPDNPESWATLLRIFASAHFGKVKPGGKLVWDHRKLSQLLADLATVESSHPFLPDEDICKIIKKVFPTAYAGQTADTLRRTLQYARNPNHNANLKLYLRIFENRVEERAAKSEPKKRRRNIHSDALKVAIQAIAKDMHRPPERPKVNVKRSVI